MTVGPERAQSVAWHGTGEESVVLLGAIARNCACGVATDGAIRRVCAPHRMLIEDQRALDGLLFARRLQARWIADEHGTTAGP